MNKVLYRAAKPIFDAACELPTTERKPYVERACRGDAALRRLVFELLATHADDDAGGALGRAIDRSLSSVEHAGATIDRFVLQEPIGEGGFGTVWRAEQREPVRRMVALKMIKPGMDTRKVVARFEAERQALALMDHPNIAQVLDGGATEAGRPYFAMELVDGVPVTDYCRTHELSLRDRLRLFVRICAAIQHAHQKGVIHRDVKPSNVLVTEHEDAPFPKVIDFGIAKAIASGEDAQTQLTEQHQVIGTPEYMAPEQLDGGAVDVDTRADVYALGVLLYELLTGVRPFEKGEGGGSYSRLLEAIRTRPPQKPSTRAAAGRASETAAGANGRLHAALRGDLDSIVLRALAKERGERYESAGALAADVVRHLRNEPVSAGPPSATYRLRKFVARNRAAVGAGALVLLSLVAGLVGTGITLGWALDEKTRADRRLELALDAVTNYHTGVAEDVMLRRPDLAPLRARLLAAPRAFYEQLEQSLADTDSPAERRQLAAAVAALARLLEDVGEGERAISAYQRATDLLGNLEPVVDDPTEVRFQRVQLLTAVGALQNEHGRVDDAIATLEQSIDATVDLKRRHQDSRRFDHHLADANAELGSVLRQRGDLDEADRAWRDALAIYGALFDAGIDRVRAGKQTADTYNRMGRVALNSDRVDEARELFASGRDIVQRLLADAPDDLDLKRRVATSSNNLGNACSRAGDAAAAKTAYDRAVQLEQQLHDAYPGVAEYRHALGNTMAGLAGSCQDLDDSDAAKRHFGRALELLATARSAADRRYLAQACNNYAGLLEDLGELDEAVARFRDAVRAFDALLADTDDPDVRNSAANCLNNFASLLNRRAQSDQAAALFERSLALREQVLDVYSDNPVQFLNLSSAAMNLARLHFDAGRFDEAIPLYTRSIEATERVAEHYRSEHGGRWWTLHRGGYWGRANAHQQSDHYELAVSDWMRAARIDDGDMRAPYLTQLFGDLQRGGLLDEPTSSVRDVAAQSGAENHDLLRVGAAFVRSGDRARYGPLALALTEHLVERVEREEPAMLWRCLDLQAGAQAMAGQLERAVATQQRALESAPAGVDGKAREGLARRLVDLRARAGQ